MIIVPNIWGQLPTLAQLAPAADIFNLGHSLVQGNVIFLFLTGKIADYGIVYTAVVVSLVMSLISAAYVVYKTVDATINYTILNYFEYAFWYRGGDVNWGDNIALYQLVATLFYEGWSLALTIYSLMYAMQLWDSMD